jgi:hypothetical protein
MSIETDNVATVVDGEALISVESIESFSTVKDKIKGMPETDGDGIIGSSRTNAAGGKKKGALGPIDSGAIGTLKVTAKEKAVKETKPEVKADMVAVFSTKNVSWSEVGDISKGYNILSKSQADKWLTRGHVRLATPEEVAEEYGV